MEYKEKKTPELEKNAMLAQVPEKASGMLAIPKLELSTQLRASAVSEMRKSFEGGEASGTNALALSQADNIRRKAEAPEIVFPRMAQQLGKTLREALG